jgi:hypothetical protein
MDIHFKIQSRLLAEIRADLLRPHTFAAERVGFILAAAAGIGDNLLVLAHGYRPVDDHDYVEDRSVGAMMGPEAIRKAQEWSLLCRHSIFHVHTHGGRGLPAFSFIDRRENPKFVPDFLKTAPHAPHGAIVLSDDMASGEVWVARGKASQQIDRFTEVGASLRKWTAR